MARSNIKVKVVAQVKVIVKGEGHGTEGQGHTPKSGHSSRS